LVAVVAAAAIVSLLGLALESSWLAFAGLAAAIIGAAGFALHLIVTERRRHEVVEEELSAQSSFLESLIESMSSIAAPHEPEQVLDQTRREARGLFGARATLLPSGAKGLEGAVVLPLRIRGEEIGSLQLLRARPLDREELARAKLLADFACRAVENVVGITLAAKGKSDLALSVIKNSVSQIAVFLYPVLVLASLFFAQRLTFVANPVLTAALALAAIAMWGITGDGKAAAFEGWALAGFYVILAALVWYE
jgi:hypothetical protein